MRATVVGLGIFFALTALHNSESKTSGGDLILAICASILLGIATTM